MNAFDRAAELFEQLIELPRPGRELALEQAFERLDLWLVGLARRRGARSGISDRVGCFDGASDALRCGRRCRPRCDGYCQYVEDRRVG